MSALDDFTMVGAGVLSSVLSRSLVSLGFRLDQVVVRQSVAGQGIVDEVGCGSVVEIGKWSGTNAALVLIAVSDDQIEKVSLQLAREGDWSQKTVLHTSGVHGVEVLTALKNKGAHVGSFHPLQSFVGREDKHVFKGSTIGIEGDARALESARHLADGLLADAVEIQPDQKALYHAAAVLAGNASIALLAVSEEVWEKAVGTKDGFSAAMGPLVQTSINNALTLGPGVALTGPVVRGDVDTLRSHIEAISAHLPHLLPLYSSIATETVHLAVRSGRLSTKRAVALLDVISDHIKSEASTDG